MYCEFIIVCWLAVLLWGLSYFLISVVCWSCKILLDTFQSWQKKTNKKKKSNQLLLKGREVDDEEEAIKWCFAKTGRKAFLCGRLVYVLLPTGFEKSLIRQSRGRGGEPQGCVSRAAPSTNRRASAVAFWVS